MAYDSGMRTINYITEYDNETISDHGPGYISYETDDMFGEEDLPTLSADGMIFEGWYTTSTYDDGTKVNVGDVYAGTSAVITLYAKWSTPTVSSLLTNLADELRTLTNTSDKMGLSVMAEHVSDANDEIADQDAIVEQLISAMNGKSVPPSGGTGGSAVETCTVTYNVEANFADRAYKVYYCKDGVYQNETRNSNPYYFGTVEADIGTLFVLDELYIPAGSTAVGITVEGCTLFSDKSRSDTAIALLTSSQCSITL